MLRPRGLPEAVAAVPAALVVVAAGALTGSAALHQVRTLAPTIGFLAAILVLGDACAREGLFTAAGRLMARGARGRPRRLLGLVFLIASAVTAVLSLDATVVLLTPVVFASAAAARLRAKPHVYACVHLANAASLLLPVSNLTNLLAFRASGLSFTRFAGYMAPPWLAAIAVEWFVLRRFFARELAAEPAAAPDAPAAPAAEPPTAVRAEPDGAPRLAIVVVALTLAGFAASSALGVDPAIVAGVGALALAIPALAARRTTLPGVVRAASPAFLVFVLALAVVVRAAQVNGLDETVQDLLPAGASLGALLAVAAIAAVLANVVNNIPATLILLPALVGAGRGPLLAALIGVGVGPNLTYAGSLATLLWRRQLRARGIHAGLGEFVRLGIATVPAAVVLATVGLWVSLRLLS